MPFNNQISTTKGEGEIMNLETLTHHGQVQEPPAYKEGDNISSSAPEEAEIKKGAIYNIRKSQKRRLKNSLERQLINLEEISKQGKIYLEYDRFIEGEIAEERLSVKAAKQEKADFVKKTNKKEKEHRVDTIFHLYWSELNYRSKVILAKLTLNRSKNWLESFIGATWEQLKQISRLPKITKEAIARLLGKETKPKPTNKIKYNHPIETAIEILEKNQDKLSLNSSQIENYKSKNFETTYDLIKALEKDDYPILDLVDKRSKPLIPSLPDVEELLKERIEQEREADKIKIRELENELENYQTKVIELEEDIAKKEEQISELKSTFELWKKEQEEKEKIASEEAKRNKEAIEERFRRLELNHPNAGFEKNENNNAKPVDNRGQVKKHLSSDLVKSSGFISQDNKKGLGFAPTVLSN